VKVSNNELARLRLTAFSLAATGVARVNSRSVGGEGWVAGMGGCIAGCAHPLEKSGSSIVKTSIHRLEDNLCADKAYRRRTDIEDIRPRRR
jgi:hypothetical protein